MATPLRGSAGAAGFAHGPAYLVRRGALAAAPQLQGDALGHFARARAIVASQMRTLATDERAAGREEIAQLFDFMELLTEDPAFIDRVAAHIQDGEPLPSAISTAVSGMASEIAQLDSPYLRERTADILALGHAFAGALAGAPALRPPPGSILVAADLTPAELIEHAGQIAGIATAEGGATGHLIILARTRGIPAVVGLGPTILEIPDRADIALDGARALVWVAPEPEQLREIQRPMPPRATQAPARQGPCRLIGGPAITLLANISHPSEVEPAIQHGAEGVGLLRSEFLFVGRATPPSEDEQYAAYRETLDRLGGRPLVVRTLDVGGDKPVSYLETPPEPNPALGLRGLRYFMRHPALLQPQLRALLRAAPHGDLRIMLPMITTVDDLLWARDQIAAAAAALAAQGRPLRQRVPVGAMIETPAAALTVDLLAPLADFFSIGTNDLAQYTLAADRASSGHAGSYALDAPAVLRLIKIIAEAARRASRPVAICGELAAMPSVAPLLVGIGVHELSMSPPAIEPVCAQLMAHTHADLLAMAAQALS